MKNSLFILSIVAAGISAPLAAQWLNQPTAGLPRTKDGKPDLSAAAPRTADGKPDLSGLWTAFVNNPLIQLSIRIAVLYVLALYLAMVFWTVRDAQQRTENQILPYLGGLMVVVLNLFGLFLYLVVRPKETLGEAYERQLAEVRSPPD